MGSSREPESDPFLPPLPGFEATVIFCLDYCNRLLTGVLLQALDPCILLANRMIILKSKSDDIIPLLDVSSLSEELKFTALSSLPSRPNTLPLGPPSLATVAFLRSLSRPDKVPPPGVSRCSLCLACFSFNDHRAVSLTTFNLRSEITFSVTPSQTTV